MTPALARAQAMVAETPNPHEVAWYMPSQWFFRQALRESQTREEAVEVGMRMALELEHLREWCETVAEVIPPKRYILESEAAVKRMPLLKEDEAREIPWEFHPVTRY